MRQQERLVSAVMKNASRLRVFMTADAMGGVWQYALDLASGLKPHGVETVLATIGPNPSAAQRSAADAAGLALVETELPLDWTARQPREIEEAAWALARLATDAQPDIVHLNSPALAGQHAAELWTWLNDQNSAPYLEFPVKIRRMRRR